MAILKPEVITQAWADSGTFVSPPATASTLLANQATGYPLLQSTKYSLGGIPVQRDQTNGAFNLYSSILAWEQAGGTFTFEPTVSAAYSGYNEGTMLAYQRIDGGYGILYSPTNGNTSDFIATPSVIGTDWIDIANPIKTANPSFPARYSSVGNIVDGNYTLNLFRTTDGTNFAQWGQGFSASTDSVYKPFQNTILSHGAGQVQDIMEAADTTTGFQGFTVIRANILDSDIATVIKQYYDNTLFTPRLDLYATDGNISVPLTGISIVANGRPFSFGALSPQPITSPNDFMIVGDVGGAQGGGGTSYYTLPSIGITGGAPNVFVRAVYLSGLLTGTSVVIPAIEAAGFSAVWGIIPAFMGPLSPVGVNGNLVAQISGSGSGTIVTVDLVDNALPAANPGGVYVVVQIVGLSA